MAAVRPHKRLKALAALGLLLAPAGKVNLGNVLARCKRKKKEEKKKRRRSKKKKKEEEEEERKNDESNKEEQATKDKK